MFGQNIEITRFLLSIKKIKYVTVVSNLHVVNSNIISYRFLFKGITRVLHFPTGNVEDQSLHKNTQNTKKSAVYFHIR